MAHLKEIESLVLKYTMMYLQKRNLIMLALKYGITPIY
jgi:hypothetical protein